MVFGGLNIAIAQINPIVGHIRHNAELIGEALTALKGADLVVFPELVLSGYPPEDLVLKPSFVADCHAAAMEIIATYADMAFILTTPWAENGRVYNAAIFADHGKITGTIYKRHLPNYGVFDERRIFSPGEYSEPVEFMDRKIGVLICEDIWHGDGAAHLKSHGAQMILSPNGSPFQRGKHETRVIHARNRIQETGLPLLYVNQVGGQDDIVFDGGSFAMDGNGRLCFQAPHFLNYCGHISHELHPVSPQWQQPGYEALKLGLKDYLTKNNFPGVILGMSGGIDSALSAVIAADAIGADKVRCVMMPSPFTSQESLDDAKACADAIGCPYEIIPIGPMMAAMEETVSGLTGLAHENMQSRARGMILMALSNQSGAMVLSTGNKSEMAVGYATLYGDMCGGYNVLKDVYKTDVYALAQWRNKKSLVIPENIIVKAPTAELRPGQTDQDSLPPYDVLDRILEGLIERDLGEADLIKEGYDTDTVHKIQRLLDLAEYKRRQSAPGVKVTTRAFGRDRRYPITNGYGKK